MSTVGPTSFNLLGVQEDNFLTTKTWATIRADDANDTDGTDPDVRLGHTSPGTSDKWNDLFRISFYIDLDSMIPTDFFKITAMDFDFYCSNKFLNDSNPWSDTNSGLVVCSLDETGKAGSALAEEDYQLIYDSGMTEYTNAVAYSSIPDPGAIPTMSLNSAGLAYVNGVMQKSSYAGKAYFGLVFVGDARNVTPTWVTGAAGQSVGAFISESTGPTVTITYDETVLINIGDVWKTVASAQINVGDVWKDVTDLNLNVGDVWKYMR